MQLKKIKLKECKNENKVYKMKQQQQQRRNQSPNDTKSTKSFAKAKHLNFHLPINEISTSGNLKHFFHDKANEMQKEANNKIQQHKISFKGRLG